MKTNEDKHEETNTHTQNKKNHTFKLIVDHGVAGRTNIGHALPGYALTRHELENLCAPESALLPLKTMMRTFSPQLPNRPSYIRTLVFIAATFNHTFNSAIAAISFPAHRPMAQLKGSSRVIRTFHNWNL